MNPKEIQGISGTVSHWLDTLSGDGQGQPGGGAASGSQERLQLLQRAGRCYAAAGWAEDAGRVFHRAGDFRSAAAFYEQRGLWEPAAGCFAAVGDWANAARCFGQCGRRREAAECLEKAGQPIEAAWLWAHYLRRYQHARALVRDIPAHMTHLDQPHQRMAAQLVMARCECGLNRPRQAGKRLYAAIDFLTGLPPSPHRHTLDQWAHHVANRLNRPDLTASLYAAAVSAKVPGAVDKWEAWSMETLGEAAGLPVEWKRDEPFDKNEKVQ